MRKSGVLFVLALFALAITLLPAEEEKSTWFDPHNCAFCQNMASEEGLLESMEWETHLLPDGLLSVAMIPENQKAAFERSHKNMEITAGNLQAGEHMQLCGFCTSYGELMRSGVQSQNIESKLGHISLLTSDDPKVVEQIHKHAKRTIAEYDVWLAEMAAKGS